MAKHKTPEGGYPSATLLPDALAGLSSKTGQNRGFYGRCGSFPQGSGAVLAGDVEPGPSLCSESGDEENGANSLLWKE